MKLSTCCCFACCLCHIIVIVVDIDKFKEKFQPLAYRLSQLVVLPLSQLPLLLQWVPESCYMLCYVLGS